MHDARPAAEAPTASPSRAHGEDTVVRAGDRILLFEPATDHRFLLLADGKGARKERGLGVVDPGRFVGQPWGANVDVGQKRMVLLPATLDDLSATIARKAQIILPKDLGRILFELSPPQGGRVFESGIGSGAATLALATAVGPTGRVVVQELRADFQEWALGNLERAGVADRVEVHLGDATQGIAPQGVGPFDCALLDLPEPWGVLPHLVPHLAPGARVACYTPQVSQMEETHRTLSRLGFASIRCVETIERSWEVKERGSRPSFEGLGHTAFLTFARWLGRPVAPTGPETRPGADAPSQTPGT